MKGSIAFFDFDGTITTDDSLPAVLQYYVGKPKYYLGVLLLSPMLAAYYCKLLTNHIAKEKFIAYFLKGKNSTKFRTIAKQYSLLQIDKILRPSAMVKIKWHQERGHKVVIVSASMECWLQAWCDKKSIALISTRLESKNNKFTGRFATKNCYGMEKVNRIKKEYTLEEYKDVYAYGDSSGDKEMLNIATKPHYRYFH